MLSVYEEITKPLVEVFTRYHLKVIDERYEPQAFGNYLLLACSDTVCARLLRDRGQWFIDLRSANADEWVALPVIAEKLGIADISFQTPIKSLIGILAEHFDDIQAMITNMTCR